MARLCHLVEEKHARSFFPPKTANIAAYVTLQGGPTELLIQLLFQGETNVGSVSDYVDIFLLTYRSFTNGPDLFAAINRMWDRILLAPQAKDAKQVSRCLFNFPMFRHGFQTSSAHAKVLLNFTNNPRFSTSALTYG